MTTDPPTNASDSRDAIPNRRLEIAAWLVLLTLALVSRFYDLGTRAMSHDEGLHTWYSWQLFHSGHYQHDPMMHGPVLFHANALIYLLFGDTDLTSRILPALAGVAVLMVFWCFRRYMGRPGALAGGILVLVSPSLLFYSRYIRNDIYISLFMLVWTYSILRYLESDHAKWLWGMVLAMALSFACKEVTFIHGMVIGSFLDCCSLGPATNRGASNSAGT